MLSLTHPTKGSGCQSCGFRKIKITQQEISANYVWLRPVVERYPSKATLLYSDVHIHACMVHVCTHSFTVFLTYAQNCKQFLTGTQPVPPYGRHAETGREVQWVSLGLHRDGDQTRSRRQRKQAGQEAIGSIATPLQKQHLF